MPVALTVSSPPTATPSSLPMNSTQGSATPVISTISVNGPDKPVSFTATVSTATGGNWLTISPTSGSTPAVITVQANPAGLGSGQYAGSVAINFGSTQQTVSARLSISPVTVTVVPNALQFRCQQGGVLPGAGVLSLISSDNSPVTFMATAMGPLTVNTVAGSTNMNVAVTPAACQTQGSATGSITVNTPGRTPAIQTVPVTVVVDPPAVKAPVLNAMPSGLTFSFVQGSVEESRGLTLANQGGGTLNVTAAAGTAAGGPWLSVSCPQSALSGAATVVCPVTADPGKVPAAGTYRGEILITDDVAGQSVRIPVTMTVTALANVLVSHLGMSFSVVQGGINPPADTVDIVNGSAGTLNWTATPSTASGGNWLKINGASTAASGSSTATNPALLSISVDGAGLKAGIYYGSLQITATDVATGRPAANSPRTVAVALNVLVTGSYLSPIVRPNGLTFSADAGAGSLSGQSVSVYNLGSGAVSYSSAAVTDDGGGWCKASPATGTVNENGQIGVQVDFSTLAVGTHSCTLRLLFGDGSLQNLSVLAVTTSPGVSASARISGLATERAAAPQAGCDASKLPWTVNLTSPGQGGTVIAYQGASLEAKIVDGCTMAVVGANVSVSFGNGDPSRTMVSAGGGLYRASWTPTNVPSNLAQTTVLIQVVATPQLGQGYQQGGSTPAIPIAVAQQVKSPTLISKIVNSASYAPSGQVAPCSWVAIFGQNLADSQVLATVLPLGDGLGNANARLGGSALPLSYVDGAQINAQIPCGLNANTQLDLQVLHGGVQSPTEQVVVSESQPAIFTMNQQGYGQGAIFWTTPGGTYTIADEKNPPPAGSVVEIYCTGLGPVTPQVKEGTASPTAPETTSTTMQTPAVTIGGVPAKVLFSGLTPGAVGLYQINVVVPENVPRGSAVPVLVTMNVTTDRQTSQDGVTMSLK